MCLEKGAAWPSRVRTAFSFCKISYESVADILNLAVTKGTYWNYPEK